MNPKPRFHITGKTDKSDSLNEGSPVLVTPQLQIYEVSVYSIIKQGITGGCQSSVEMEGRIAMQCEGNHYKRQSIGSTLSPS